MCRGIVCVNRAVKCNIGAGHHIIISLDGDVVTKYNCTIKIHRATIRIDTGAGDGSITGSDYGKVTAIISEGQCTCECVFSSAGIVLNIDHEAGVVERQGILGNRTGLVGITNNNVAKITGDGLQFSLGQAQRTGTTGNTDGCRGSFTFEGDIKCARCTGGGQYGNIIRGVISDIDIVGRETDSAAIGIQRDTHAIISRIYNDTVCITTLFSGNRNSSCFNIGIERNVIAGNVQRADTGGGANCVQGYIIGIGIQRQRSITCYIIIDSG